jgi:demethylmenaquinone methyltransferase/2-methoxy-6-polyprenyl-1,4-benzoquinol methylase
VEESKKKETSFGNKIVPLGEKKGLVQGVFDSVAEKYDLMNDLMSFGTHRFWKRFLSGKTRLKEGDWAIDVCGGTADIAMLMAKLVGENGKVVVFDINRQMLKIGRDKGIDKGFLHCIDYVQGNAEDIGFPDNTFQVATVGFGIRNVTLLKQAFKEMMRVVKPGGRLICLEFSHVDNPVFRSFYDLYSFKVIPEIGRVVTGNRGAYEYLVESIRKFPKQEELKGILEEIGLYKVRYYNLFGGVAAMHIGVKI